MWLVATSLDSEDIEYRFLVCQVYLPKARRKFLLLMALSQNFYWLNGCLSPNCVCSRFTFPAECMRLSISYFLMFVSLMGLKWHFYFNLYFSISEVQWHPTPVLLPGKYHGRRSLVGRSPWGREELDMTEWLHFHFSLPCIGEGNGNPLQCSCLENPRDGGAWWAAVYGVTQSWTRLKWLSIA